MDSTVALPWWLFAVLSALAAVAVLDRVLYPGLRWYFRRKMNRVIEEINVRWRIELPHFKLTRRQVLIDRLVHDARVQAAAETCAREQNMPASVVLRVIERYAGEIVPAFNAFLYYRVGYAMAKAFARLLYRVRLGYVDAGALAAINPRSSVVFVMNHRSNMDYVLVAFLAAERVALSYAVGEWARVWPLQTLVRAMGAYFVRRNSGDPLYRMVLQRYVHMATEGGVPQAVFPEGGLTLDGRLRAPKLGLIDYMVKGFDPAGERDVVFVPVGINYDRVLEDRTLTRKLAPDAARLGIVAAASITTGFLFKQLWLAVTQRWYRFGYACVNFGRPLSLREYVRERHVDFRGLDDAGRHAAVAALGSRLMDGVGAIVPVLPVALTATVLLRHPAQALSELELKSEAQGWMVRLEAAGHHVYVPRADRDYAIGVGLRMLLLRHLVVERDGLYAVNTDERVLLEYYANSIAHLPAYAAAMDKAA